MRDGNNGKSVVLGVLHRILGAYSVVVPRSLVIMTRNEPHPTEKALLYKARLAVRPELPRGVRMDEAKVKETTGGDPIECHRMYEDFWSFLPSHKLWIASNHLPTIEGTDEGIWRRNKTVKFPVRVADDQVNPALLDELVPEFPGILNWILEGVRAWREGGLRPPATVKAATASYRQQQDVLGGFLALCTAPGDFVTKTAMRLAYEGWCRASSEEPVSDKEQPTVTNVAP